MLPLSGRGLGNCVSVHCGVNLISVLIVLGKVNPPTRSRMQSWWENLVYSNFNPCGTMWLVLASGSGHETNQMAPFSYPWWLARGRNVSQASDQSISSDFCQSSRESHTFFRLRYSLRGSLCSELPQSSPPHMEKMCFKIMQNRSWQNHQMRSILVTSVETPCLTWLLGCLNPAILWGVTHTELYFYLPILRKGQSRGRHEDSWLRKLGTEKRDTTSHKQTEKPFLGLWKKSKYEAVGRRWEPLQKHVHL